MSDFRRFGTKPGFGSEGFSLIQVMVMAAILSIVAMVMAELVTEANHQLATMNARLEANSLSRGIETLLGDAPNCGRNMQANGIQLPAGQLNIATMRTYNTGGTALGAMIPPPAAGNVRLQSISVRNVRAVQPLGASGGIFYADLRVDLQPTNPRVMALRPTDLLDIKFVTDSAGNVISCGYRVANCVVGMIGPKDSAAGFQGKLVSNTSPVKATFAEVFYIWNSGTRIGLQCNPANPPTQPVAWLLTSCRGQALYNGAAGLIGTTVTVNDTLLPNGCYMSFGQVPPAFAQSAQTGLYATCCTAN